MGGNKGERGKKKIMEASYLSMYKTHLKLLGAIFTFCKYAVIQGSVPYSLVNWT